MTNERDDTLPTERVGIVVCALMEERGKRFKTADLARLTGLRQRSMWAMLAKLSRSLPLAQDHDGWYILPPEQETR
jgi:hypothetical protein